VDRFCAETVGFMLKTGPNTRNAEGRPPLPHIGKFLMPKRLLSVWRVPTVAAWRALRRMPLSTTTLRDCRRQVVLRHSLLDVAVAGDMKDVEERLGAGVDPDVEDPAGEASLHDAAWCGDESAVELLLKAGADPNARDAEGNTPLHVAARRKFPQVVLLLLKHGADPNAANARGETPLDLVNCPGMMRAFRRLFSGSRR
jgi:ankyrin repeat protein